MHIAGTDLFAAEPMVFVDLETTGGTAGTDRITEVGLVEVSADGVREWSSLVNPQTSIPPFIERLTGISNAMVRSAPRFEDIAAELLQRLQGKLFLAHNARFDYGFLKREFERAGIDFSADVVCTVRLSRRLHPEHSRHNLDSLIARHGLQVQDRHRALGDARLIWQFWQKMLAAHGPDALNRAAAALAARPSLPPNLDPALLEGLPDGPGVYLFYGENELPLYIGKSKTLRRRVLAHFSADIRSAKEMALSQQVRRIDWISTEGELGALLQEAALVKKLQPIHNRQLRRASELCSWQLQDPGDGYLRPVLRRAAELKPGQQPDLYGLFSSVRDAKKQLTEIAEENLLCQATLGLQSATPGKPCFGYQLGRCAGACVGKQSAARYNAALQAALLHLRLATWPYPGPVAVREGEALHVIDHWCHLGTAHSEAEVWELLESGQPQFDRDSYRILSRMLPSLPLVQLRRPETIK